MDRNGLQVQQIHLYLGTGAHGEWIQIELPYKIKLSDYIFIYPRRYAITIRRAARVMVSYMVQYRWNYWSPVTYTKTSSDSSYRGDYTQTSYATYASSIGYFNDTKVTNIIGFVTRNVLGTETDKYVAIGELKLYGHRENDLVRLPDPTNVLKYPHIAMTGPAQRGYVANGE